MVTIELGQTVVTAGVDVQMKRDASFAVHVKNCMDKHSQGDWGDVCSEDKGANDSALKNGERLLSVYGHESHPKIWIITERDRSSTTVLFPDEY